MIIPANSAAEQVQRLSEVNTDIDKQIDALKLSQVKNIEIINAFTPLAEWAELPDPEPETAPEPDGQVTEITPEITPEITEVTA